MRVLGKLGGRLADWVKRCLLTVLLIRGQAAKREERERNVVGAFTRQKVPVVLASELLDQRNP